MVPFSSNKSANQLFTKSVRLIICRPRSVRRLLKRVHVVFHLWMGLANRLDGVDLDEISFGAVELELHRFDGPLPGGWVIKRDANFLVVLAGGQLDRLTDRFAVIWPLH